MPTTLSSSCYSKKVCKRGSYIETVPVVVMIVVMLVQLMLIMTRSLLVVVFSCPGSFRVETGLELGGRR